MLKCKDGVVYSLHVIAEMVSMYMFKCHNENSNLCSNGIYLQIYYIGNAIYVQM